MTLVYLGAAWIAGILLAQAVHPPWQLLPLLGFGSFLGMVLWRGDKRLGLVPLCVLIGVLGAARLLLAEPRFDDRSLAAYNGVGWVTLEGVVFGEPDERDRHTNLRIQAERLILSDGIARDVKGQALVQTGRYPRRSPGDRLRIAGNLESPPIFEGFSYRDYLARRGVYSYMRRPQMAVIEDDRARSPSVHLFSLKRHAQTLIAQMLPEPQAALLTGILLGVATGIPKEVMEEFAVTGTAHVIVISGFNITMVAGIFAGMAGRLFHRRWALLTAMISVAAYTVLVGASAAVVRAAVMGVLYLFGRFVGRKSYAPVSLAAAVLLMTAWNPYVLWDTGFLLSFAATAGLLCYTRPLERLFERVLSRFVPEKRTAGAVKLVSEALLVTVAAQIATMPMLVGSFGRLSPVMLLTNALILPAQTYIILIGGFATFLGLILHPLGQIAAWPTWVFLTYTLEVVRMAAALPRISLPGEVQSWMVWMYYVVLVLITWWLGRPLRRRREMWSQACSWLSVRLGTKLLLGLSGVLLVLALSAWRGMADGRLHVHFLDVGQGDAIFIRTPSGRQVLIDGGPSPSVLLSRMGRRMPFWDRSLDVVLLTHPDEDHITGLVEVLERYRVDVLVFREMGCQKPICDRWDELALNTEGMVWEAEAGLEIKLEEGVWIEVLHPGVKLLSREGHNDNSLVIRLRHGEASFLFTGDIGVESEHGLLTAGEELQSTVLKVAHHGAGDASTAAFLEAVDPEVAVISVGEDNDFGHPCQDVLERLEAVVNSVDGEVPIYRTDRHGTVHVVSDGACVWVNTER